MCSDFVNFLLQNGKMYALSNYQVQLIWMPSLRGHGRQKRGEKEQDGAFHVTTGKALFQYLLILTYVVHTLPQHYRCGCFWSEKIIRINLLVIECDCLTCLLSQSPYLHL